MKALRSAHVTAPRTDIVLFGDFRSTGGVERSFANVIPEWVRAGQRVEILGYRAAECFYPDELDGCVQFVHTGTSGKIATVLALWRFIRRRRPAVVVATGHISNLILSLAAALPRPQGTRCFLNVQNDFVASGKDKTGRKRGRKLRQIRRWYPCADGLLVTSRGLRDNLVTATGLKPDQVRVIYSGVITDWIHERAREEVDHPWLDPRHTQPVILGAGRLKEQKDFPTLVRAFARLREWHQARLILIGEGEDRPELEHLVRELGVAEDVDMPGFTPNPYAWIARADVFALSSRWEGFGNVVAEALALGVPVVSTSCPSGPAEILGEGEYGRLVPVGDPQAMALALAETLAQGNRCSDPCRASGRFTAPCAAREYLAAFGIEAGSAVAGGR